MAQFTLVDKAVYYCITRFIFYWIDSWFPEIWINKVLGVCSANMSFFLLVFLFFTKTLKKQHWRSCFRLGFLRRSALVEKTIILLRGPQFLDYLSWRTHSHIDRSCDVHLRLKYDWMNHKSDQNYYFHLIIESQLSKFLDRPSSIG